MGILNITDFVIVELFRGFRMEKLLGYNNDYGNWGRGMFSNILKKPTTEKKIYTI